MNKLDRLTRFVSSFLPAGRYRDEEFRRNGYMILPGLVPASIVESTKNLIDLDLAQNYDVSKEIEYSSQSYCPSLRESAQLMALLTETRVWDMVEWHLGHDTFGHSNAQIAIRKAHNSKDEYPPEAHIDGIKTAYNGLSEDELETFTALVGVFLTNVDRDFAGNFTVWPGSHLLLEDYFRKRGPQAMYEGMPEVDLGAPEQLRFSAGDVVFCHYQLAHCATVNLSDNDRYAVYFRIALNNQKEKRYHRLTNIWDGWLN